jgi:hypothetical protein
MTAMFTGAVVLARYMSDMLTVLVVVRKNNSSGKFGGVGCVYAGSWWDVGDGLDWSGQLRRRRTGG